MQILSQTSRHAQPHAVLVFGLGMIGRAIRDALLQFQYVIHHELPFDWHNHGSRRRHGEGIQDACSVLFSGYGRASLVWSAGRSNFFSPEEATEREMESFGDVLELAASLKGMPQVTAVDFHLISSAGGLFEGQKFVTASSHPTPRRPYGRMKLALEQRLKGAMEPGEFAIYRPSSVYGPMLQPKRHGLINKLISNVSRHRSTVLDAHVMALRDYVYAGDVGRYIARQVRFGPEVERGQPVHFLVSARCASIFEVVRKIERMMNRRVRFRYDEQFGNSASITFAESALPSGWRPSTLDVGIRQFILKDMPQTRPISAAPTAWHSSTRPGLRANDAHRSKGHQVQR